MTIYEFARQTGYTVDWLRKKIRGGDIPARDVRASGVRDPVWDIDPALVPRFSDRVRSSRKDAALQRDTIRKVLETAAVAGEWLTLAEIRNLTQFGETSISAQIRNLRKACYGAHKIDRRYDMVRGYEYQIQTNTKIHNDTKVLATHA